MSKYESRQEVAQKAEWEGGLLAFIFDYGVDPEEMPDTELADAMRELVAVATPLINKVEALLPDPEEEG